MILTAFDGGDVAEWESPLGGHASQRATDMIRCLVVEDKPFARRQLEKIQAVLADALA